MGFFSGLSGLWGSPPTIAPVKPYLPYNIQKVGHVVDVILDTSHPKYDPSLNQVIGTVFWRDAFASRGSGLTPFKEATQGLIANPIDRSNFKVPLPGEQVLVFKAKASKLEGPDVFMTSKYFYTSVVNMSPNPTINAAPFIGLDPSLLNPGLPGVFTVSQLAKRFDKKIKNIGAFKEGKKPIVHKQLQLNEGDFILQGRFGGSIRFAGTPVTGQARGQKWAEQNTGLPGDPIVLMRVNPSRANYDKIDTDEIYEREDMQSDPASIYLTTSQQVKFKLAIPEKGDLAHPLATWAYSIGITSFDTDIEKTASNVKDGEAARAGENKTAPKEVSEPANAKEITTAEQPPTTGVPDTPTDEDAQNNPAGYNPVTGQSGVNSTASEEGTP